MKKFIFSFIMIFFSCMIIKSQEITEKYFLAHLPRYEISDSIVCSALDTVLFSAKNCPFFKLQYPYYLVFAFYDNKTIQIGARVYTTTYFYFNMNYWKTFSDIGYFYYKDLFVLLMNDNSDVSLFFKNTGISDSIFFQNNENIAEHITSHYAVNVVFDYKNKRIILDEAIDLFINNHCEADDYLIYYIVKEYDTEESIAAKFNIPIEKFDFDSYPLIRGTILQIAFDTKDGTMNHCRRISPSSE